MGRLGIRRRSRVCRRERWRRHGGGRRRPGGRGGGGNARGISPVQRAGAASRCYLAQCHGAVQQVFKFAHVAFQRLGGNVAHELRRQGQRRAARLAGDAREQRLAKQGQVFAALAQGRHDEFNDVQAVIQVLPEVAGLHLGGQVFVGGADDAHVYRLFLGGAQRANAPLLYGAQQLGLHGQGQVADFVQKQRAARSGLKKTNTVLRGAGVGAFACAEKFGFEQVLRNGAAIDGHERPAGAVAACMHGIGHQLFARARFAVHQHGGHAAGHFGYALLGHLHGRRLAYQPRQRRLALRADVFAFECRRSGCSRRGRGQGGRGRARRRSLRSGGRSRCCRGSGPGRRGRVLQGGGDNGAQLFEIDRLGEVVKRAGLEGFHGGFGRAVGRHHDAALRPSGGGQFAQQLHAQTVRQAHVGNEHVKCGFGQGAAGFGQRAGGLHLMAFADEGQLVEGEQVGFVINDKNACGCSHGGQAGSLSASWGCTGTAAGAATRSRVTKNSLPSTSCPSYRREARS